MVILVFPNIKKCTMYSFVNHHSHMKMIIRYCVFFFVGLLCRGFMCIFNFFFLLVPSSFVTFAFCIKSCCLAFSFQSSKLLPFHTFFCWFSCFLLHEVLSHYHLKFVIWKHSLWLCTHFLLQFDSIGTLMLLLFVVRLNAIVITCVKLLRTCTVSICVQLIAWSHVLKYSSYFSSIVFWVWAYFSSKIKLVALTRSINSTNILLPFFVAFTMLYE